MTLDPFLHSNGPLSPRDAVAAIMVIEDGCYLLQHRDPKPDIFYPSHWGFFGGAGEPGETDEQTIVREIREETGLDIPMADMTYFTDFKFDFAFAGRPVVSRVFFQVPMERAALAHITLGEGQQAKAFDGSEALASLRMVPYDSFALWMHLNRGRLVF